MAILLFVAFNASAQIKYDYAVITYIPSLKSMQVSSTGQPLRKVDFNKEQAKGDFDVTGALLEIDKMQENGWELTQNGYAPGIYTFFLRRKKA